MRGNGSRRRWTLTATPTSTPSRYASFSLHRSWYTTLGLMTYVSQTTIRVLGGLLSAYHFSNDSLFLDKAVELADRIMPAFNTPSGLPLSLINLAKREGVASPDDQGLVSTAEVATLQLEFRYLSYLTENDEYWDAVEQVGVRVMFEGQIELMRVCR